MTPSMEKTTKVPEKKSKAPVCTAICEPHPISMRKLTDVIFTFDENNEIDGNTESNKTTKICPLCKKSLSNTTKLCCKLSINTNGSNKNLWTYSVSALHQGIYSKGEAVCCLR